MTSGSIHPVATALGATRATLLGSGTFGDTYLVENIPGHEPECAVKLLKADGYDARRVARETEGMQRFDGPGVAKLLEVRTIAVDEADRSALICEYIPGGDVAARLHFGNLPTNKQLRKFGRSLLGTVAELHAANTIHRDIKPMNIMLRDGKWGRPVLIDFGMSRMISDPTITVHGAFTGSYAYMPPEHLQGEPARKQADLWAVGVTLFELAMGHHPFIPDSVARMSLADLVLLVSGPTRPLRPDLPADIRVVIERLLQETPHRRGTAARAVKDLIER